MQVRFFQVNTLPGTLLPRSFYYVKDGVGGAMGYLTDENAVPQVVGGTRIAGEVPAGLINNSNTTFTTSKNFIPGTEEVFVNGMKQTPTVDYVTSNDNQVILHVAPMTSGQATDTITINYNAKP